MKNVVICGDSFSIGIGCHNLHKEPYGSRLANHFDKTLINFAKGSSTNFSIFLQVKHVVETISPSEIEFVCIAPTSYNRVEWFPENVDTTDGDLKLTQVNYHQYPPYGTDTYQYILENPIGNDKNYTGEMFTENYYGIVDYVDNVLSGKRQVGDYYSKFKKERSDRLKLLRNYYADVFDDRIQRYYDIGVITMAYGLLKSKGIKAFVLTYDPDFKNYIPEESLVNVDWGILSQKYPDDLKTLHTSAEGHKEVFESIMQKIEQNGWYK
jgi:hypothetical protein